MGGERTVIIEIKAKYPIEWDREYYLVGSKEKNVFAPCVACDNKGKVEIKGEKYRCPRCHGNWREKEVVSTTQVFHVEKYKLSQVEISRGGIRLRFEQSNNDSRSVKRITVRQYEFETMQIESCMKQRYLIDDYKEAIRQVKAANAAEKSQKKGA